MPWPHFLEAPQKIKPWPHTIFALSVVGDSGSLTEIQPWPLPDCLKVTEVSQKAFGTFILGFREERP